ncbi:MAG TPA: hypothetical protein VGP33_07165 [Chloroflexota bacterium]|nr:hypothetical protein [Chloroflexota bacterium]
MCATFLPGQVARAAPAGGAFTGWVMDAYPDLTSSDFVSTLTKMKQAGANMVWLGHNNPVDADPNAREVALSYAVYAAAMNPADPQYAGAQSIVAAQVRALDAARSVGLKLVLPVGYQTQMGAEWDAAHPDSLRRGPDGSVLNFGGESASPYDGTFRSDMTAYYQWIEQHFVAPYHDVVLMVMISNEPTGVDYSSAADYTFFTQYQYHFADVGNDPQRELQLGRFQSHVIDDFAIWAAQQWEALDPGLTVTLTFDGSPARNNQQAPALEALFRDTPANFQPAWDAQILNGPPTSTLNDSDVTALGTLLGTLAHFSAKYQRQYWLWSSGNSWGLSQGSSDPSNIADAISNLHMLADLSRQGGGLLRGIALWAYNVRGQGLYNDSYHPQYDPADLFRRLTAALPGIRSILAGPAGPGADALILAPNDLPEQDIGASRLTDIYAYRGYNFGDLVSLLRAGANTAVVGTLAGEDLRRVRLLVIAARGPGDLSAADRAAATAFRSNGGTLVDAQTVDGALALHAQWVYPGNAPELFFADSYTADKTGPVAAYGLPRLANSFVFKGPSELVVYGGTSFDPPQKMKAWLKLPFAVNVTTFAASGSVASTGELGPGTVDLPTQRHTLSILPLVADAPAVRHDARYFAQTGFRIDDNTVWNYFSHRGGVRTFGYPTSRTLTFQGFRTQFFQREVVQIAADGSPQTINLLDPGLLAFNRFNNSTFPAEDPALIATAPTPGSPDYGQQAIAWALANAPDTWQGIPVNFGQTFLTTVSLTDAYPAGGGNPSLVPLLNLELWGLPTSAPAFDPHNHNFVYQRFQRGVMHYDAGCGCTQGILLADYLKALLLDRHVPADLAEEAAGSPFLGQYAPTASGWLARPGSLPGTDLTRAFEPG